MDDNKPGQDPEIQKPTLTRLSPICKVCKMMKVSNHLTELLYAYRFDEQLPLRELASSMTPHIEEWNKNNPDKLIEMFSFKGLSTHFNKHAPSDVQMKYQMQAEVSVGKSANAQKSVSLAVQKYVNAEIAKSVSTFNEMTEIFHKLKRLYTDYEKDKPQISSITIHLEIIREMRATLSEISKLKQGKELIRIAVRSVIDTFITAIIDDSGASINKLRDELAKKVDQHTANRMTEEFRRELVDVIVNSAKKAVDRVRKEFALDNETGND